MKKITFLCLLSLALLNSCIGASADIVIHADGSGKIFLEYRVSQMLESMGRLDGNARWPAIPVGKADFERSLARTPGITLSSFSAKETRSAAGGKDLVTRVALKFQNTASLLAFLDYTGSSASFNPDTRVMRLVLLDTAADADADLNSLLRDVFSGYTMDMSFTVPKNASLTLFPPVAAAKLVTQGKKVSFSIGMGDLVTLAEGLMLEVSW